MKVEANTLFYNGGNLSIASDVEKTVINEGNIYVTNTYTKIGTPSKDAGKEFVNVHKDSDKYGQLIVAGNGTTNTSNTGFLTVERASVNPSSINYLNMGIPFQGQVETFNDIFGVAFRGNCVLDKSCGQRYSSTLQKWNNNKIVWDAVPTATKYQPGYAYNLNLWNANLTSIFQQAHATSKPVSYRGRIAPESVTLSATTLIPNYKGDANAFSTANWGKWKKNINNYNEFYETYVANNGAVGVDQSTTAGKNFHQFGNPFTSNIDLSKPDTYLRINGQAPSLSNYLLTISKFTTASNIQWNNETGTTYVGEIEAEQVQSGMTTSWTKSGEALLIRPFEKFTVNVKAKDGSSDLVDVEFLFNDQIKTFIQDNADLGRRLGDLSRSAASFSQLEVYFTKANGDYMGFPIYLSASNKFENGTIQNNDGLNNYAYFLQEDGESETPIANSETTNNVIADNYVGKPITLGLTNDVATASEYAFKFKLYDDNIFGAVESNLVNGRKFFLEDRKNSQVIEIQNNQEYVFNLNEGDDLQNRFAVYWQEYNKLGTNENELNKYKTLVYKNNNYDYFVRLNNAKKYANIEVYNLQGQKVDDYKNVVTTSDFKLANLTTAGVYIVKLTYADGENFTTKVIVK